MYSMNRIQPHEHVREESELLRDIQTAEQQFAAGEGIPHEQVREQVLGAPTIWLTHPATKEALMTVVTIEEARERLPELIAELQPGEEIVIDQDGSPVAKLTRSGPASWPCRPGSARHLPHWMAPDFDAPLEDFREYME
jgi:antitoxin (DNA-binding transcriptional repressor) of toxin-antitoxin stability system